MCPKFNTHKAQCERIQSSEIRDNIKIKYWQKK